jgi:protein TonB
MNATAKRPTASDKLLSAMGTNAFAPAKDRLTTTLFLAALFHAIIIIGVNFTVRVHQSEPTPTLEVVLLAQDGPNADDHQAQYLAQRSEFGSGTTSDPVKVSSPQSSPLAAEQAGTPDGSGIEEKKTQTGASLSDTLHTRKDDAAAVANGTPLPATEEESPLALMPTPPSPILTSTPDEKLALQGPPSRSLIITPDTRAANIAPYLGAWKRKIERIGTLNYPSEARRKGLKGSPVLEVTIRADGSLGNILVVHSSGYKEIDQAALAILRLAAPFDPFPSALKRDYDDLRFAYEWQFMGNKMAAGALRIGDAPPNSDER